MLPPSDRTPPLCPPTLQPLPTLFQEDPLCVCPPPQYSSRVPGSHCPLFTASPSVPLLPAQLTEMLPGPRWALVWPAVVGASQGSGRADRPLGTAWVPAGLPFRPLSRRGTPGWDWWFQPPLWPRWRDAGLAAGRWAARQRAQPRACGGQPGGVGGGHVANAKGGLGDSPS